MADREAGSVKGISERGFFFLRCDHPMMDGKDLYAHVSGLKPGLLFNMIHIGDRLSFEIAKSERGFKAVNIERE
jgi:cold shock CspA family protein